MNTPLFMKALISASILFAGHSCASMKSPKAGYIEDLFKKKNAVEVFKGTRFEGTDPLVEFRSFLGEMDLDAASNHGELLESKTDESRIAVLNTVKAAKKAELRQIFPQFDSRRPDKENYLDGNTINGLVNTITTHFFKQKLASYVPSPKDVLKELFARKEITNVFKGTPFEGTQPENEFKTFLSEIHLDAASEYGKLLEPKTQDAKLSVCTAVVDAKKHQLYRIFKECPAGEDEKNYLTQANINELVEAVTRPVCMREIETYVPKPIPPTAKAGYLKQLFANKNTATVFKGTQFEGTDPENDFKAFLGQIDLNEASDYGTLDPKIEEDRLKILEAVREAKKLELKAIFKPFVAGDNPRDFLTSDNINAVVNLITRQFFKEEIKNFDVAAAALKRPLAPKKAKKIAPVVLAKKHKMIGTVNKPKQAIKHVFGLGSRHSYRNKIQGTAFKNTSELEEVVKFLQTIHVQAAYDKVASKGSVPTEDAVKNVVVLSKTAELKEAFKGATRQLTDEENNALVNGITLDQFSKEWVSFTPKAPVNPNLVPPVNTNTDIDKKKPSNNNKFILGGLALFGFSVYLYNQYKPTDVNLNTAVAAA